MKKSTKLFRMAFLFMVAFLATCSIRAFSAPIAITQSTKNALLQRSGNASSIALKKRTSLYANDVVQTASDGNASLLLTDGSQLRLGGNTKVEVTARTQVKGGRQSFFRALSGEIFARLKPGSAAPSRTAIVGVRGTLVHLQVSDDGTTTLTVLEGSVDFFNEFGSVTVNAGQQSTAALGQAPTAPVTAPNLPTVPEDWNRPLLGGGLNLNATATLPQPGVWHTQAEYADLGEIRIDNNFADDVISGTQFDNEQEIGDARLFRIRASRAVGSRWELGGGIEQLKIRNARLEGPGEIDDFDFRDLDGAGVSFNAKYQAWRNRSGDTLISVGGGYSHATFRNLNLYIVGTKSVGGDHRPMLLHLGMRYDHFKVRGIDRYQAPPNSPSVDYRFAETSSKASIFLGAEVPLDRRERFSLVGEIGSKNSEDLNFGDFDFGPGFGSRLATKFPYSLSIRYQGNGWVGNLGVMRQGVTASSGIFAQVGKAF